MTALPATPALPALLKRFAPLLAVLVVACATHQAPAPAVPSTDSRLAAADALVRAGCFDCLRDALAAYRGLAATTRDPRATVGVGVAAGLLAIRERELGLVDQHAAEQAREAGDDPDTAFLLDVVATLPRRFAGTQRASDDKELQALMRAVRNRDEWRARLSSLARSNLFAAGTAIEFECAHGERTADGANVDALFHAIGADADAGLMRFTKATCTSFDTVALAALAEENPRFAEVNYFLGVAATLKGRLDEADERYQKAFAWRQDWPAVTIAIGHLAMTAEDFDRAADFYRRTLAIVPGNADARIGLTRALSYGGQPQEAIATANELLAGQWYIGDAYYWRAFNEAQLDRIDEAWADVHEAAKLVINADVPKLTGILAVRREDLRTARAEFETARDRNGGDCETLTLLGGTVLELREWTAATPILVGAVSCLDAQDEQLRADIERLRATHRPDRIVARREQTIASDARLRLQSWFNLAIAAYNAGDRANARAYAERVVDDAYFGERARQLMQRLKPE